MTDRPDLTELERLLAAGAVPGNWSAERVTAFERACSEFLGQHGAALLADARKAETLRETLVYLAEWDETKAAVLGSPDFRLIASAALEGAPDA